MPAGLFIALGFLSVAAEEPKTLSAPKQPVVANREATFLYPIKNTGKESLILNVVSGQDRNECRPYIPLEPVAAGATVTVKVVCHFMMLDAPDGSARNTRVLITTQAGNGTPVPYYLKVDAEIYRKEIPSKRMSAVGKNIDGAWDTNVKSGEIQIENSATAPRLVLRSATCAAIDESIRALANLKERLEGKRPKGPVCGCDPTASGSKKCFTTADDVLPEFLFEELNARPYCAGPNCFNTALRMTGLLPSPRFTSEEELDNWLKSPLCHEVGENETPLAGDIIDVRDEKNKNYHAFTYLSPDLVYTKNGKSASVIGDPFIFTSATSVFSKYDVPKKCRRVASTKLEESGCKGRIHASYFRCMTLDEYAKDFKKKHPHAKESAELVKQFKNFNAVECRVSSYAMLGYHSPFPLSDQNLDLARKSMSTIVTAMDQVVDENDRESLMKRLLMSRIEGIESQIKILKTTW